jgi:hypothetical protein
MITTRVRPPAVFTVMIISGIEFNERDLPINGYGAPRFTTSMSGTFSGASSGRLSPASL